MESNKVNNLICQFLHESGYANALSAFEQESGYRFASNELKKSGELLSILDEYHEMTREKVISKSNALGDTGDGSFANTSLLCLECLVGRSNILALRLTHKGVLILGSSGGLLTVLALPVPLPSSSTSIPSLPVESALHAAALITIDGHPALGDLVLTGSMDRKVCLVKLSDNDNQVLQTFNDHKKFVVRVRWAPSGAWFATASYDQTVCIYRQIQEDEEFKFDLSKQFKYKGQVEGISFRKGSDVLIVSVRNDNNLHVIDLREDEPKETRQINMNALGDDYISFTAMDINCCPFDKFILVSTDKNRLMIIEIESGKQIANVYGSLNDEYSQPKNCWHPSGQYIYSTSQDKSIVVWDVASQTIATKLQGHTAMVRDLWYCEPLSVLVSCGFDASVRLWHNSSCASTNN